MINLDNNEIMGLYLNLKRQENSLDPTLLNLLSRIERLLYENISVEEIENLSKHYDAKTDILKEKG